MCCRQKLETETKYRNKRQKQEIETRDRKKRQKQDDLCKLVLQITGVPTTNIYLCWSSSGRGFGELCPNDFHHVGTGQFTNASISVLLSMVIRYNRGINTNRVKLVNRAHSQLIKEY